jgi:hypothetical protein
MKTSTSKSQQQKESEFPVLKFDYNFNVIYSNTPAQTILDKWNVKVQESVPETILSQHPEIVKSLLNPAVDNMQIRLENTIICCTIVPFPEAGYIGVYGYMVEYAEKIKERATVLRLN